MSNNFYTGAYDSYECANAGYHVGCLDADGDVAIVSVSDHSSNFPAWGILTKNYDENNCGFVGDTPYATLNAKDYGVLDRILYGYLSALFSKKALQAWGEQSFDGITYGDAAHVSYKGGNVQWD